MTYQWSVFNVQSMTSGDDLQPEAPLELRTISLSWVIQGSHASGIEAGRHRAISSDSCLKECHIKTVWV
ncbi:hypothetical protein RRG08_019630 [Elysia crispata]|uniref:Uncharacterized protein n=1 Tax=Elysia crispata TaxID=231223 RepID=A0AAE1DLE9_9GAST|nr:hypothetical protein RRG08_019630 [Elysia crispata]